MDETLTPEHWLELKGRIQQQYPQLSDADLQYHEAVEQDLLTMVKYSILLKNEMMLDNIAMCA